MSNGDSLFPFEIVMQGIPISLQSKRAVNREAWKDRVRGAALERQQDTYPLGFLDERALAVTIYYFPTDPMPGDIDNIIKPIMDALIGVAYLDDRAIERVTVAKFEPGGGWEFVAPSDRQAVALDTEPPVVYIRVDDDLSWRRVQ